MGSNQPYYVDCDEHGFMPMSTTFNAKLVQDTHALDGCNVEWGKRDELDEDPLPEV